MTEEVKPVGFDISKAVVSLKGKKKFDELSNNDIINLIQIDFQQYRKWQFFHRNETS